MGLLNKWQEEEGKLITADGGVETKNTLFPVPDVFILVQFMSGVCFLLLPACPRKRPDIAAKVNEIREAFVRSPRISIRQDSWQRRLHDRQYPEFC